MHICPHCKTFHQNYLKPCATCGTQLKEVSLSEALEYTDTRFLRDFIKGKTAQHLTDLHKQYHIRNYLGNQSLFLNYNIQKNRMKHGPKLKRFLICPVDMTAVFNIPWFFFNIITSNLFHLKYRSYCKRCNTKCDPKNHTQEECDYNIEYFSILADILNGNISIHKPIYKQHAIERKKKRLPSAYDDLFEHHSRVEAFFDVTSITLSVLFWLFIIVFISFPFAKNLSQKIQHIDHYEFGIDLHQ